MRRGEQLKNHGVSIQRSNLQSWLFWKSQLFSNLSNFLQVVFVVVKIKCLLFFTFSMFDACGREHGTLWVSESSICIFPIDAPFSICNSCIFPGLHLCKILMLSPLRFLSHGWTSDTVATHCTDGFHKKSPSLQWATILPTKWFHAVVYLKKRRSRKHTGQPKSVLARESASRWVYRQ